MSSDGSKLDTRTRILDSALELMRAGASNASLVQIAKAAGVSRQAVYLHFADRADLYVALVRHVDEQRDLAGALRRLAAAPTGEAALQEAVDMQARMNPALWPLATAMDAVRRQDEAIERAWQDRLADRLEGARDIARRIEADGALRPGLDVDTAADLIWAMISLRTWEDLVIGRDWSAERYRQHIGGGLRRMILDKP
ncbi:MAG TPA: TetR family transcriptional regulator [Caulobacteraceae bacterium]|nr:TetR family transcriptional regulator [Caulobacteraceae bacterium]